GVELAELLVVGAIDRGEEHARGVVLRKGDLVAAGVHGTDGGERGDRAGDGRNGDEGADCHGVSPLALAAPAPYRCSVARARRLAMEDIRNPLRRLLNGGGNWGGGGPGVLSFLAGVAPVPLLFVAPPLFRRRWSPHAPASPTSA